MNKFCIFPIKDNEVWSLYKKQIGMIWTVEEIDFSKDYNHFIELSSSLQHIIKYMLIFFSNTDGLINYNISKNFLDMDKEVSFCYVFQMFMEQIHNETYSMMIETLIKDNEEKDRIFNSLYNYEIIKEMNEWGLKYSNGEYSLSHKVLAFLCFEGIIFSGAFSLIFWIKKYCSNNIPGFMNGLIKSNELISRDEGLHTEFAVLMYNYLKNKPSKEKIIEIITEAVTIEKEFITESLSCELIGMNAGLMSQYIQYIADRLLKMLSLDSIYKSTNPFPWMELISVQGKTNFFEKRVGEYAKANVSTKETDNVNTHVFSLEDDF